MKRLKRKSYKIGWDRIFINKKSIPDSKYKFILIMDMNTSEYYLSKFTIKVDENLEDLFIINIEDDYNFLTDQFMRFDIKIIGFLERLPYSIEYEQDVINRYESERKIREKE